MPQNMRERLAHLEAERARILQMGGPEKVNKQHARGKLTARARLARFFDEGQFFEIGLHGTQMGGPDPTDKPAADAVICGWGKVEGRPVASAAYDFTVKGGSIGMTGETKVTRLRELALRCRMPMVWFIDSAGAGIDSKAQRDPPDIPPVAGTGQLFCGAVVVSGGGPPGAAMVRA